jgi:hypothetical protein
LFDDHRILDEDEAQETHEEGKSLIIVANQH